MHVFLGWLRAAVGAVKRGAYKTKSWIGRPITRLPELKPPTDRRSDPAPAAPAQERRQRLIGGRGAVEPRGITGIVGTQKYPPPLHEDVQGTAEISAQILSSELRQTAEGTEGNEKKTPRPQ